MQVFACQQCGLCCHHVHLSQETRFLDRGDGICKYYEIASKLCSIYPDRPDICRVGLQYELRFAKLYSWDEYVALNLRVCASLQKQEKLAAIASVST